MKTQLQDIPVPVALDQWKALRLSLASALTYAADNLLARGVLPDAALARQLLEFQRGLQDLHVRVTGTAGPERISLEDLSRRWNLQQSVNRYRGTLDCIADLKHMDDPAFAPLADCQESARAIASRLATDPASVNSDIALLDAHEHPLQALCELVDNSANLDDSTWAELNERITDTFGRSLATALARGRIVRSERETTPGPESPAILTNAAEVRVDALTAVVWDAPVKPLVQNEATRPTLPVMAVPTLPQGRSSATTAAPVALTPSSIFDDAPPAALPSQPAADTIQTTAAAEPLYRLRPAAVASAPLCESSVFADFRPGLSGDSTTSFGNAPTLPPLTSTGANSLMQLSRQMLQAPAADRRPLRQDLLLQLIYEGRLALAFHLERVAEQQAPQEAPLIPAWLIRALVLSRTVRFSRGETARLLEQDLQRFTPAWASAPQSENNLAMGILIRAAAMLPALFTASPAAIAVLRAFRIGPDSTQLYNYCSRLALYGQKFQGQLTELSKQQLADSELGHEQRQLQAKAGAWFKEISTRFVPNVRSSPLYLHAHWTVLASAARRHGAAAAEWSRWQDVFRIVWKLLKPVIQGVESDRTAVKQEIERVSRQMHPEGNALGLPAFPAAGPSQLTAEMRTVLAEALDFASQWIRLTGGSPAAASHMSSLRELQQEINQRTSSVLVELKALAHVHPGPIMRAAVACCTRVVETLQNIFESGFATSFREPDPRHVLNGELLKLPAPQMNDQWLPQADGVTLEQELLELISHPQVDWTEAFHWQSSLLDHVTTGRLLELDVWSNTERQELSELRELAIVQARIDLEHELSDTLHELREAAALQLLSEQDVAGSLQRIERLKSVLPQTTDLATVNRQIQQIRKVLERRQHQEVQRMERRLAQLKPRVPGSSSSSSILMTNVAAQTPPPIGQPSADPPDSVLPSVSAWVLDV